MDRIIFEARRICRMVQRALGIWGMAMLACALTSAFAAALAYQQSRRTAHARLPTPQPSAQASPQSLKPTHADALATFEERLLPPEDLPRVVNAVLEMAEKQGLVVQRGTYRPQVDTVGRLMRYRMTLPVQGLAPDIQTFLQSALLQEKMLALESVQFKRESTQASQIDARIQWLVFTRMPSAQVEPTP
jgi:hypothetical protein